MIDSNLSLTLLINWWIVFIFKNYINISNISKHYMFFKVQRSSEKYCKYLNGR